MKNNMKKYFTQKQWTPLEILCLALAIVAGFAAVFVWGGGPIGAPICVASIIALVVSKSQKVKDSEVESLIKKTVEPCLEGIDPKEIARGYDLSAAPLAKGRDGIWRTPSYVAAHIDFREDGTHISVWRLNLLNSELTQEKFALPKESAVRLHELSLPVAGKTAYALECEAPAMYLSVPMNDVYAEELIRRICQLHQ